MTKKSSSPASVLYKSLLMSGCFLCTSTFAASPLSSNYPGISLTGTIGSHGNGLTGYADMMAPIFSDEKSIWYLDPQGLYHNSTDYAGSLGFGWRQMANADNIIGAYVFADYSHSPNNNGFWFISPGVERLGTTFDFSANLYIPTGTQEATVNSTSGNQIGTQKESIGIGADAEIGYRLPFKNNSKVYLGGYYFNPKDSDAIKGATVKLEVPINNHLNAFVSDGYDNVMHNTVKVGLTLNLGGRTTGFDSAGIKLQDRLLDPIHRNLAATNGGWQTNQPITLSNFVPTHISTNMSPTGNDASQLNNAVINRGDKGAPTNASNNKNSSNSAGTPSADNPADSSTNADTSNAGNNANTAAADKLAEEEKEAKLRWSRQQQPRQLPQQNSDSSWSWLKWPF